MKIFVLGSNSFGGSYFVDAALSEGHNIIGVSRSPESKWVFSAYGENPNIENFKFFQKDLNRDLRDIVSLAEDFQPDIVVDFAGQGMVAPSWESPWEWYSTNLTAKSKLYFLFAKQPWIQKYIRVSTPEVYGHNSNLIDASCCYNPSTPYAVSHAAVDMHLMACFRQFDFPIVFTRFANFYGSRQKLFRIVPKALFFALIGRSLPLHGGGNSRRAFIHGYDVAQALLASISLGKPGQVYHFSGDEVVTIRELVSRCADAAGVDFNSFVHGAPDRPGKDGAYMMNDFQSRSELNWKPKVDLKSGISECRDWLLDNLDILRSEETEYIHTK